MSSQSSENKLRILKVVLVDTPIHLQESFDYLEPEIQTDEDSHTNSKVQIGSTVQVNFRNKLSIGYVVDISDQSQYVDRLKTIEKVISNHPVFNENILQFYRLIAKYYGTKVGEILKLAIPKFSEKGERIFQNDESVTHLDETDFNSPKWCESICDQLEKNQQIKYAIRSKIGFDNNIPYSIKQLAQLAIWCATHNKTIQIVLPENRDVETLRDEIESHHLPVHFAILSASLTPSAYYANFLRVLHRKVRIIFGTRSSAFAPIEDPDLIVVFDDYNSSHKEMRKPYSNSREILLNKVNFSNCSFISLSVSRSTQIQRLVNLGFIKEFPIEPAEFKNRLPEIDILNSSTLSQKGVMSTRIPSGIYQKIRQSLESGPVLIVTPRNGYIPLLRCSSCFEITHCSVCGSSLKFTSQSNIPVCSRCSKTNFNYHCPKCNSTKLRASRIGSERTADEIGKAFPGVPIKVSSSTSQVVQNIDDKPRIVIATPQAIPIVPNGYQAIIILDATLFLVFDFLDTAVDSLHIFFSILSYSKPRSDKGYFAIIGDIPTNLSNSILLLDPVVYVNSELIDRKKLKLPPYARVVTIIAEKSVISKLIFDKMADFSEKYTSDCILGPFELAETNYRNKFTNFKDKDMHCLIIRVPIKFSSQIADEILRIRTEIGFELKNKEIKILFDPKEFL